MTTVNYPTPVLVNGYACKNCTDVDYAKRHIDPQHPKDGPYGIDKTQQSDATAQADGRGPAVVFGGSVTAPVAPADKVPDAPSATQGARVDVTV